MRGGDALTRFGTKLAAAPTLAGGGLGNLCGLGRLGDGLASTPGGPAGALRGGDALAGFRTKFPAASTLRRNRFRGGSNH